jgi:hypothetical protein
MFFMDIPKGKVPKVTVEGETVRTWKKTSKYKNEW